MQNEVVIKKNNFYIGNKKIRIIAGAMHYFRIPPEYWRDRMQKMIACGINTLETYIAWNIHEPQKGIFDFISSGLNIRKFILLAEELGLYVIIRPGPYICSEWDLGGLPAWLLKDPEMRLRCANPKYLDAVEQYIGRACDEIRDLQYTKDGPIIALQLENEYGSFGNDKTYLRTLLSFLKNSGINVPIFTSDGSDSWMLNGGTLPDIIKTVNFGSRAQDNFERLKKRQKANEPLFCMEFWNGWFWHWGEECHRRSAEDAARSLDEILEQGASVCIYMFHGGTNFGFMNGANCIDDNNERKYQPTTTSYDQDAPISESGELTEKYYAFKKVISKYTTIPDIKIKEIATRAYGKVPLTGYRTLFDALPAISEKFSNPTPEPMEFFDQNYGFILYRTFFRNPHAKFKITVQYPHDQALIFINGKYSGTVDRNMSDPALEITSDDDEIQLDILVENMGRINYGAYLHDHKGITEGVRLNRQFLFDWTIYTLPLTNINSISYSEIQNSLNIDQPLFLKGSFFIKDDATCDTFLEIPTGVKGVCWINGFNLGRYWKIGPQKRLYIPAPLLKTGENEVIIFELYNLDKKEVFLEAKPDLGDTNT